MPIKRKITKKCGLLLRMTPKLVEGKEVPVVDVLNSHLDFLDEGKPVWFSFSQFHVSRIERLIVFTWRRKEWFAVELFFDSFYSDRIPFIPKGVSVENSPAEWANVPEKCWAHLIGYRELDMEDLKKLTSTLTREPLSEKIKQRAFRSVEFDL